MRTALAFAVACCLLVLLAQAVLAQPGRPRPGHANMSKDERRQLRQDVDSARGNYQQRNAPRQGRMPPQEREQLRRDVQDANRDLRKR